MFLSKYGVIEKVQNKKGMNPISSPNQKNLLNKKFFLKKIILILKIRTLYLLKIKILQKYGI